MSVRVIVKHIDGKYKLYVRSVGTDSPAGDRLARGKELPNHKWEYENESEAQLNALELQRYLDAYENDKQKRVMKNKRTEEQEQKYRDYISRHNAINRKT